MNESEWLLIRKSWRVRLLLALLFICSGYWFWFLGAGESRLMEEERDHERDYVANILMTRSPDYKMEKKLAEAYWARYPDIRRNHMWGESGAMGVRGPRDHFRLHGKREGRVWGLE